MIKKIRKRDGSVVLFNSDKIVEAIWKAARAVGGQDQEKAKHVSDLVVKKLEEKYNEMSIPSVEDVQNLVESVLIKEGHDQTAKAYILYRQSHDELRNVKGLFDTIEAVEDYIGLDDWMVKENSNMGFSLQGLNNYIATKIITNYWLRRIYPEAIRKVHEEGDVHIHDLGTLGAYCFDDKTKILTGDGWKLFRDVKDGEKVATKNLNTGEIEFQVPFAKQVYNYSGKMYSYEGRGVSLLVTPEHRLLVRRKNKKVWEFINPTEFEYGMEFDKVGKWNGKKANFFQISEIKGGNQKKTIGKLKISDYLEFMGWYLSEGSVYEPTKGDFRISIAQSEKKYRSEMISLLKKMNFQFNNSSEFNIHLHSKEFFFYLKQFGKSREKYVPTNIKELDAASIRIFLTTLFKSDGTISKDGKFLKYYTNSERLAEDVCECLLKIGLCGTISRRKNMDIYMVSVENKHLTPIYRKKQKEVHYSGKVYDLSVKNTTLVVMRNGKIVVSGNCVGWDLKDLVSVGFTGVKGKVQSRPAKHLRTALMQVVNFFYTLQGETAGAQAFSNFDSLLAPFIRYDNLSYKDVKQIMQEFIFNLAVPTRVGFQTPFTNVTMDLKVPSYMKDEPVLIGGVLQKETYKEFEKEMAIFNKAFAEVMLEGDASGRVFTFPIPTYNITKDFEWDNRDYDLIWEMTAKYGIPYFSNFVNSDMKPEDARSMCCRLRLDQTELRKRGGGLFGANPQTGSIGVVTLNMSRIGFVSSSKEDFLKRVELLMELAKESLEIKRKAIEKLTDNGLYPYTKFYLRQVKERFGQYWKNHFATIGLLGMNEAITNFMPGETIASEKGNKFAIEVLDFMRRKMEEYQKETGNIYNLEATPGEGTTYRFARMDKKKFGKILVANEKDFQEFGTPPYYTNSTQLPVNYTHDLFEALELQDVLQTKYTGGTVFHAFVGEKLEKEAVKNLVKKIADKFSLPYYTITPTFSVCPIHGYIAGEHEFCPLCEEIKEVDEAVENVAESLQLIKEVKNEN
ncbi:MAG: Anaerobic ribonucleoside-triphosphate reductase [candidate division WS2 bacterium]|uniref:Anaerobic ribonucleoside-triphosphate reductase n=1 Tax=Psychracetigena formicireducens TaxID=2986056 RepID=A0A9E2BL15_PSYF1|nr:Anaerobic ribonucleoside-triphosphate reductase [Candidatus Psychracetigena formicireducens]